MFFRYRKQQATSNARAIEKTVREASPRLESYASVFIVNYVDNKKLVCYY